MIEAAQMTAFAHHTPEQLTREMETHMSSAAYEMVTATVKDTKIKARQLAEDFEKALRVARRKGSNVRGSNKPSSP